MKTLVTGAAGFIGSHLVDALRKQGTEVMGLDSLDPGVHHAPPDYLRKDVDYCFADLRHWIPDSRFDDVEQLVHLAALGGVTRAAREPANIVQANAGGTARLAETASGWKRLRKVVLISSFSVYGANYSYRCDQCGKERNADRRVPDLEQGQYEVLCEKCGGTCSVVPITENACPNPLETYGASKYMQELCFRNFSRPLTIVRLSSVYGQRLRVDDGEATIIAKLAGWINAGITPRLFEDGRQLRDWVYVDDVVATVLAALDPDAPPLINVCSGIPTSLTEACYTIANVLGKQCEPIIAGGFRPGDMRHCLGDPTRMSALLKRSPIRFSEGAFSAFAGLPEPACAESVARC